MAAGEFEHKSLVAMRAALSPFSWQIEVYIVDVCLM